MKVTKVFLLFIVILTGVPVCAQIKYFYDASGNRVKREVILKSAEIQTDSTCASLAPVFNNEIIGIELKNPALEETFGELQVKLYPNPTQGAVYFEIDRLPEGIIPELEIWGPSGQLIGRSIFTGQVTRINLWGKPGGIYFIKADLQGTPVTWKIIKQ
jgi:hypothetical protein